MENKKLINNSDTRAYPIIFTEEKELICMRWGNWILTTKKLVHQCNRTSVPSIWFYSESQYYFYQYEIFPRTIIFPDETCTRNKTGRKPRKYYLLWKANSLKVMKVLVHNKRFQGIISFPKSSSDFCYCKTEIFPKTGQKITMVGGKKRSLCNSKIWRWFVPFPAIYTN